MPDARVQAAIDNWAPRFIAQGVDYNDVARTTSAIERWDAWLDAWCDTAHIHAKLGVGAEVHGRARTAGEAYVRAALCYHFAKFLWLLDMERHRAAAHRAIECLYAAHRLLDPTAERIEAPFEQTALVGNLRRPPDQVRPPLVLLLPGLDSTKEEFFSWENTFLARGMATLSLDGPGQGEAGYTTHIHHDYEVAVAAMLDALAARDDLNLSRVGAAGVSLGGYYAPRAAAFESRIRAVAAIGGPYNFGECWPGLPALTREAFAHYSGARDDAEARQKAHQLDLKEALGRLKQPLLVVFGKLDPLIPPEQAERVVAGAPHAELVMYPEGTHVCNNIPYKYRPLVADWMREQL
jgi:dipeptidyl aminopeptidase/acylaminoacyl peptidase